VVEIGQLMLEMGKDTLGAETTLAYQIAAAWAAAEQMGLEPYEFIREIAPDLASIGVPRTTIQHNITNGGLHAKNSLDMQEFMVEPVGETTAEHNEMADNIDRELGLIYKALGLKADPNDKGVGDLRGKEGGYKIEDLTNEKLEEIYAHPDNYDIRNLDIGKLKDQGVGVHEFVLNCQLAAIKNAGYIPSASGKPGTTALDLDAAATSMLVEGHNNLYNYEGRQITSTELIQIYASWVKKYPIRSIEDGLGEDDWEGWVELIQVIGDDIRVVVDDLTVTQGSRFMKLIDLLKENGMVKDGKVTKKLAILIKLNQNGFLTTGINKPQEGYLGTLEVIRLAKEYGIEWIVSHRSNEAEPGEKEVSIAELAAGTNAIALKSGDHVQAVRAVKEDRLAAIDTRERTIRRIAEALNVDRQGVLKFIKADGIIYRRTEGEAFEDYAKKLGGYLQTTQTEQKAKALIIAPGFFRIGGARSALNEIAKLGKNVRIALYGVNAQRLKILLGNEDIVTGSDLRDVSITLSERGINLKDTVLLRASDERVYRNINMRELVAEKNIPVTLVLAKALKELFGEATVVPALEEFLSKMVEAEVILQPAYSENREALLAMLKEGGSFTFSEALRVTQQVANEIGAAKKVSEDFMGEI
jgi:enolase